jgi:riboflavin kinase / FMN adenylyltransferase
VVFVYNSLEDIKIEKPIVTIGSFDGVHIGHRKVINGLIDLAKKSDGKSVVITFWPHPSKVLYPTDEPTLLSTSEERIELLKYAGIDYLIVLPFTIEFSQLSYQDFIVGQLVNKLGIDTLLLGYDNKLGRDGAGHFNEIESLSQKYKFKIRLLDALTIEDIQVSSTRIRELLGKGDIASANNLLGYCYGMKGLVEVGQRLGSKLGFPTANIVPDPNKYIPGIGVYAIQGYWQGKVYKGMMNIGYRPTVTQNAQKVILEAHLFEFGEDIYGKELHVKFAQKIRDELAFPSIEVLKKQLVIDKINAMRILNSRESICQ